VSALFESQLGAVEDFFLADRDAQILNPDFLRSRCVNGIKVEARLLSGNYEAF
jgi:hypothetical protein